MELIQRRCQGHFSVEAVVASAVEAGRQHVQSKRRVNSLWLGAMALIFTAPVAAHRGAVALPAEADGVAAPAD